MYNTPDYSLQNFSEMNEQRANRIFKVGDKGNLYWATALAEEVGEIAGAIKKLERGFNRREFEKMKDRMIKKLRMPINVVSMLDFDLPGDFLGVQELWVKEKKKDLGKEIADVFTYLDLIATKNGINIWEEVKEKFNEVSDEMQCPYLKIQTINTKYTNE